MEWAADYAPTCPACQDIYENKNEHPPCDTCRVELDLENKDAAHIYMICRGQVITAGEVNQIIDLNYATVQSMMDLYEVENKRECFGRVANCFHHFLQKGHDDH